MPNRSAPITVGRVGQRPNERIAASLVRWALAQGPKPTPQAPDPQTRPRKDRLPQDGS